MRDLAAKAGLESEEDVEKFVGLLQDVLAQAHELNKKIVDPTLGETARIDDLRAVVEAKKAEAPTDVSIGAQAWNGSKAGFLSAVTGFAIGNAPGKDLYIRRSQAAVPGAQRRRPHHPHVR